MRTSNHQVDGEGCSWRQTFTDAAGRMHWDHVFVTELLSNSSYRPVHDFIMGAEYTAVARVRRALAEVPKRYLKCLKTDCLVMQDVPKKHRSAIERLLRLSHRDGTPVYRCEPTEGLRGQYREPRMEALRELGDTVHIITKTHAAVQNVGLGAQTADHWVRRNVRSGRCSATWLVIEELTQLDTPLWADIACLSMNTSMRFLLLGDFRQLPAVLDSFAGAEVCRELKDSQLLHDLAGGWCHELSERWRFDEGVFSFLQWLRVDEAEQVPLREAVQMARQRFPRRGEPEVCLVISHAKRLQINERENRRRAPEDALLVEYAGPETAGTNAPQTMRVWPGLRLVGAGGKVQKGVFVTVSEVGERVSLESGQSFEPRELLKHTRLCSAITYASVQGLTLRGR
ncbi:pfh1, partial [Symbiodinium necroappetens]